jgi:hypothetical protein
VPSPEKRRLTAMRNRNTLFREEKKREEMRKERDNCAFACPLGYVAPCGHKAFDTEYFEER